MMRTATGEGREADLADCEFRRLTPNVNVYFCAHTNVISRNCQVTKAICRSCTTWQLPCVTPRLPTDCGHGDGAPSLIQMAWNLIDSIAEFVADGATMVDKDEYSQRLTICDSCEFRKGNRCRRCGCNLKLKAAGRAFQCPEGKWPGTSTSTKEQS